MKSMNEIFHFILDCVLYIVYDALCGSIIGLAITPIILTISDIMKG